MLFKKSSNNSSNLRESGQPGKLTRQDRLFNRLTLAGLLAVVIVGGTIIVRPLIHVKPSEEVQATSPQTMTPTNGAKTPEEAPPISGQAVAVRQDTTIAGDTTAVAAEVDTVTTVPQHVQPADTAHHHTGTSPTAPPHNHREGSEEQHAGERAEHRDEHKTETMVE